VSAELVESLHRRIVARNITLAAVCVTADLVLLCGRWLGAW
jgi:hypothetical protein